ARVALKRGSERADHFAHLQWAAKSDCENYTPAHFEYRRRPPGEGTAFRSGIATSYLSLSLSVEGPRLAYWLPPVGGAAWSGDVEFEACEVSRLFRFADLRHGQRIEFPLVDGQWEVRPTSEVADQYLESLAVGRQSLDHSGSIFDASTAAGRQILPGQTVAFGQPLHWVSRSVLNPQAPGPRLCVVERLCDAKGWYLYQVQLPEIYTIDQSAELSQWLERRVRPARPKAWIESPWPRSTSASGFPVFELADGELQVRADRLVDITVTNARTRQPEVVERSVQIVDLPVLSAGVYDLYINDVPHETFVIEPGGGGIPAVVLASFDDRTSMELAYAQSKLVQSIASGKRSISVALAWGLPAVGSVLTLDGRRICQEGAPQATVLISPGMTLDAANLGRLEWPADTLHKAEPRPPIRQEVRDRVSWLLSVAGASMGGKGERVAVPDFLQKDALFRRLAMASWRPELAPQVRCISTILSKLR
ncbi:MAG: hypothetical protein ACREP9_12330, partial [Candidatus Dormibacteraceae bacterium]